MGPTPSSAPTRCAPRCTHVWRLVSRRVRPSSLSGAARRSSRAASSRPWWLSSTTRRTERSPTRPPDTRPQSSLVPGHTSRSRWLRRRRLAWGSEQACERRGFRFPRTRWPACSRTGYSRRAWRDDLIGREELTRFVAELGPEQYADSLLAQVIAVSDEAPDDMAVCVLRAMDGVETFAPRTETLVLDAEDIALGVAERFLEACDVPTYQAETALDALSDAVDGRRRSGAGGHDRRLAARTCE